MHFRRRDCENTKTFRNIQKILPDVNEYRKRITVAAAINPAGVGREGVTALLVNQIAACENVALRGGQRRVREDTVAHLPPSAAPYRAKASLIALAANVNDTVVTDTASKDKPAVPVKE